MPCHLERNTKDCWQHCVAHPSCSCHLARIYGHIADTHGFATTRGRYPQSSFGLHWWPSKIWWTHLHLVVLSTIPTILALAHDTAMRVLKGHCNAYVLTSMCQVLNMCCEWLCGYLPISQQIMFQYMHPRSLLQSMALPSQIWVHISAFHECVENQSFF